MGEVVRITDRRRERAKGRPARGPQVLWEVVSGPVRLVCFLRDDNGPDDPAPSALVPTMLRDAA